ncbi:hypothetical protein [Acetobacter senegalensis]|uniref:hypothetical protein n=1 Tax=Acetobacter senegalensis TaxID=446692 RepID=UPI00265687BC|nr:hypothetical protein [Acetobacter senegalensis]MDN7351038.1 hypothetical protein [Acetobacter senegalensis]
MVDTTLAVSDLLKAAYPAQYYGKISYEDTLVLPVYDVWGLRDSMGRAIIDLTSIPAASDLVALTAAQVALFHAFPARGAFNISIDAASNTLVHPDRYYCDGGTPACFYDAWGYSDISALPDGSELHALTKEQWQARQDSASTGLQDYVWDHATGTLVEYTAPAVVIPLAKQAASEISGWIATQASMASAMGETFTADMQAYVKAIRSIADGSDTASTKLPDRPATIMS